MSRRHDAEVGRFASFRVSVGALYFSEVQASYQHTIDHVSVCVDVSHVDVMMTDDD